MIAEVIIFFVIQTVLILILLINFKKRKVSEQNLMETEFLADALLKATCDMGHIIDEDGIIIGDVPSIVKNW